LAETVFARPESLADVTTHYCPGCTHGLIHRLVAEVIDELGVRERTVGIAPVGCSVLAYNYFNVDFHIFTRPPTDARRRWPPASSARGRI